mgnify:CR=1 FL=1
MTKIDYTKPILERDYSELLGTEVAMYTINDKLNNGILVKIASKGITIVSQDDDSRILFCLNKNAPSHARDNYKGVYAFIISSIKRGKLLSTNIYKMANKNKNFDNHRIYGMSANCAFK